MPENKASLDLNAWIPRLIQAWRQSSGSRGAADRLEPHEVRLVADGVRKLSQGLTGTRKLVGKNYLEDAALLGAYLCYYWPISYIQARFALSQSNSAIRNLQSALDLGSGPGPLAFALADHGFHDVLALDQSPAALKIVAQLSTASGKRVRTQVWEVAKGVPEIPSDLVGLGHVVNELWEGNPDRPALRLQFLNACFKSVRPRGALLALEPALFQTTRELLALRDALVKQGHPVYYPCLWRGDCPALQSETSTCHAELGWIPPSLVQAVAYAAGLSKEELKMAVLVLGQKEEAWPAAPEGKTFRVVSDPMLSKNGRTRIFGCGPEGRLALSTTRESAGPWGRDFFGLKRGDLVRVGKVQARENGFGLDASSELEILDKVHRDSRAGGPFTAQTGRSRHAADGKGKRTDHRRRKGPFRG